MNWVCELFVEEEGFWSRFWISELVTGIIIIFVWGELIIMLSELSGGKILDFD